LHEMPVDIDAVMDKDDLKKPVCKVKRTENEGVVMPADLDTKSVLFISNHNARRQFRGISNS
jgi:hypothetical protein